jgi:hypothetical protein
MTQAPDPTALPEDRARWRHLPEPIPADELTSEQPSSPPAAPDGIIDPETSDRIWPRG